LKKITEIQENAYIVKNDTKLPFEVEYALIRICMQEIQLGRIIENRKRDIYRLISMEY
jgi:hypothetical protein